MTKQLAMYDYKGFKLVVNETATPPVTVFESGAASRAGALFKTTSLDSAMRWVDAYRDGVQWAVEAKQVAC